MRDPYYVYRPLLDLFGLSEGTDWNPSRKRGRGYDETLNYGAYTGGPVELTKMTLGQLDKLQTKMLAHKDNKLNSSAAGRYQIVRTTLREIKKTLGLTDDLLFDKNMQDRMACYLLGVRGIDKWLAGRMKTETLINNLAKEWASLPTTSGKGHYSGQNASVTLDQVHRVLEEVRQRHRASQPKEVEVVVPRQVDAEVKKETNLWGWLTTLGGGISAAFAYFRDQEIGQVAAFGGISLLGILILTFLGPRLARSIRHIREELR